MYDMFVHVCIQYSYTRLHDNSSLVITYGIYVRIHKTYKVHDTVHRPGLG